MKVNKYRVILTYIDAPSFESLVNVRQNTDPALERGDAIQAVISIASKSGWTQQIKDSRAIKQP